MPPTAHAGTKNSSDGLSSDSRDRGGADDSQETGPRDYAGPSRWSGVGIRGAARRQVIVPPTACRFRRRHITNATLPLKIMASYLALLNFLTRRHFMHNAILLILEALMALAIIVIGCFTFYLLSESQGHLG